jgi:hypothetical protein
MPKHPSDPELKNEFSKHIRELLDTLGPGKIATSLSVTRQMVYNYRDGKNVPSPEVIRRAMEQWPGLRLRYRGRTLSLSDFSNAPKSSPQRQHTQYELWERIKQLSSESVEIEILKKEPFSVQLGVRIRFLS